MRLKEVSKEEFKLIFDKSPVVMTGVYENIKIKFWLNQQPIGGIELNYAFAQDEVLRRYWYADLTELYDSLIKSVIFYTCDELSGTIKKTELEVEKIRGMLNSKQLLDVKNDELGNIVIIK